MMARCKLNPCCGATMPGKCEPPPQIKPNEGWEAYEQRTMLASAPAPASGGVDAGAVEFVQPGAKKAGDRISLPGGWYYERANDDGVIFVPRRPDGRGFGFEGNGKGLAVTVVQDFAKAMWLALSPAPTSGLVCALVPPPETYGGSPDDPWTGKMPTGGSEDGGDATCNASLQVAAIPRAENTGRYLAETNDGRLLYLNHANQWQEMPNILAKPASEPAGGDVVLRRAAECALGVLTGNLDGDWDLGDPVEMLRAALSQSTSAGRVGE